MPGRIGVGVQFVPDCAKRLLKKAPPMDSFAKNFEYLFRQSGCATDDDFGREIGLERSTVNRLRNGRRKPTLQHTHAISKYCGVDVDDLFLDHKLFIDLYLSKRINSNYMVHALKTIESNIKRCKDLFQKYAGQWVVYTNRSEREKVVASLLDIGRVTKNGIEFTMINPYQEGDKYDAYTYKGYMMPVEEFLYFICEQEENSYEILTMLFHASGAPTPGILQGVWTGIGVQDGAKAIASVAAVAVKRKKKIEDWKALLGEDLGYINATSLDEMIQRKLRSEVIKVAA